MTIFDYGELMTDIVISLAGIMEFLFRYSH